MLWSLSIAIDPIQRYAESGIIRACLKNGRSGRGAARVSELVPTNRSMAGFALCAVDRDITDERFLHGIAAKVTISQPVHQVEVEVINVITRESLVQAPGRNRDDRPRRCR